jgi:hypothetical protein
LVNRLAATNQELHEHYQTSLNEIHRLDSRTKVLADIEVEVVRAEKIHQAMNTLWYETEQFRLDDVWHIAHPPRQKVLALRDKMFTTGGRPMRRGVHGAHGKFNRLQWTLDGTERLVDAHGRTESEVEEEKGIEGEDVTDLDPESDEEEIVENPSMKPMWLLKFLTSWITRWGTRAPEPVKEQDARKSIVSE